MAWSWFKKDKVSNEAKASKTSSVKILSMGTSSWPDRNYANFAKEAYLKNAVAYRCINEIAQSVSAVKWKVVEKDSKGNITELDNHPLMNILQRANPDQSFQDLMLGATAYLVLSGNSFIERISPETGPNKGIPVELYSLRPDKMIINLDKAKGTVSGYTFTSNGRSVFFPVNPLTLQGDVLQMKLFHPTDDWWGASPVESTAREIDTSNASVEWNKKLLENEARPGLILTTDGDLTETQYEQLEKMLKSRHAGGEGAHDSLILYGGLKAVPYGFSPSELDFINGTREKSREIAMGFGVPPQVIGISGESTYSNVKEARLAFWETTVMFYLKLWKSGLNNWLIPENEKGRIFITFDLDDIPALEPRREQQWAKAQDSEFLTINEKRELVGLEAIDSGDVILVPASMVPLGEDPPDTEDIVEEEEDAKKALAKLGYPTEEEMEDTRWFL